jgi:hypothetical protein
MMSVQYPYPREGTAATTVAEHQVGQLSDDDDVARLDAW